MRKLNKLQVITHIGALLPLIVLFWDYWHNQLTFNPIQEATFRTGKYAIVLLILSLACTPVNIVLGIRQVLRVRRTLGLYGFLYVCIHFFIFAGLDYQFHLPWLWEVIVEKPYALVGFIAFLILIPLAITSTQNWMRRLGKKWKQLHRLVYVVVVLGIIHYIWVQKSDIREPLLYGAVVLILLLLRVPVIRKAVVRLRTRVRARWERGRVDAQPVN